MLRVGLAAQLEPAIRAMCDSIALTLWETSMSELVLINVRDGIATVTLNNPTKLNAFAGDMREKMSAALDRVAADPSVRVLVITGAGRAFCAGGDVKHMVELKQRDAGFADMLPLLDAGRAAVARSDALPFPTAEGLRAFVEKRAAVFGARAALAGGEQATPLHVSIEPQPGSAHPMGDSSSPSPLNSARRGGETWHCSRS